MSIYIYISCIYKCSKDKMYKFFSTTSESVWEIRPADKCCKEIQLKRFLENYYISFMSCTNLVLWFYLVYLECQVLDVCVMWTKHIFQSRFTISQRYWVCEEKAKNHQNWNFSHCLNTQPKLDIARYFLMQFFS